MPFNLSQMTTTRSNHFAIVDVTFDAVHGTRYFTISSGRTKEEAIERFYLGYMHVPPAYREIMDKSQQQNRLYLHEIKDNHRTLIEANLTLIAYVGAA
jgi:hypothetical protein